MQNLPVFVISSWIVVLSTEICWFYPPESDPTAKTNFIVSEWHKRVLYGINCNAHFAWTTLKFIRFIVFFLSSYWPNLSETLINISSIDHILQKHPLFNAPIPHKMSLATGVAWSGAIFSSEIMKSTKESDNEDAK